MKRITIKNKKKWLLSAGLICLVLGGGFAALRFNVIYIEPYVKWQADIKGPLRSETHDESPKGQVLRYSVHGVSGFMNEDEEIIQKPFAQRIEPFNTEGIAVYQEHLTGKWGFINDKGEIIKKAFMKEVYAWDLSGSRTSMEDFSYYQAPSLYFYKDTKTKKYGMIDGNGTILKDPVMEAYGGFNNLNTAAPFAIKTEEGIKFGLMDAQGETIVDPFADQLTFPSQSYASGEYASFKLGDKVGIIDRKGQICAEAFAAEITMEDFYDESTLARFKSIDNELYGLVKPDGTIVVEPFASSIDSTSSDDFLSYTLEAENSDQGDMAYGLINVTTGTIIPSITSFQEAGSSRLAFQEEEDGLFGLIDLDGNRLKEPFATSIGWNSG